MIPFLAALTGSRKIVAIVAVLVVAAAIAYAGHKASSWHAAYVRLPEVEAALVLANADLKRRDDALAAANAKVLEQEKVDAARSEELVKAKAALDAADKKAARLWGRVKSLEETTDEAGCRVVRISTGFGVCFAAQAAGDPADLAACEAAGGDGTEPAGPSH